MTSLHQPRGPGQRFGVRASAFRAAARGTPATRLSVTPIPESGVLLPGALTFEGAAPRRRRA